MKKFYDGTRPRVHKKQVTEVEIVEESPAEKVVITPKGGEPFSVGWIKAWLRKWVGDTK